MKKLIAVISMLLLSDFVLALDVSSYFFDAQNDTGLAALKDTEHGREIILLDDILSQVKPHTKTGQKCIAGLNTHRSCEQQIWRIDNYTFEQYTEEYTKREIADFIKNEQGGQSFGYLIISKKGALTRNGAQVSQIFAFTKYEDGTAYADMSVPYYKMGFKKHPYMDILLTD